MNQDNIYPYFKSPIIIMWTETIYFEFEYKKKNKSPIIIIWTKIIYFEFE